MKRIIKRPRLVIELFVNVRKKDLRIVEYGTWYVSEGSIVLDDKEDVATLIKDTDHDILPILRHVRTRIINRRNPYFSAKTGKPLSKWFTI